MNQITPITDTPAGPALRLELIRLLLPVAGRDVVEVARCAEDYIIGLSPRPAPRTMADAIVDLSDRARTQPPVIGHGDEPEPAAEPELAKAKGKKEEEAAPAADDKKKKK